MPGVRRGRLTVVVLALAGAVLAGCSGGEAPRGTVNVPMYDNFFAREVTRVPAGTRVRFPNEGRTPHNAVAVDGTWGRHARVTRNTPFKFVLTSLSQYSSGVDSRGMLVGFTPAQLNTKSMRPSVSMVAATNPFTSVEEPTSTFWM